MNICYDYLRPLKAENLKGWHNRTFIKRERLDVWKGENAYILPLLRHPPCEHLFGRGGVLDQNRNYITLSSVERRVQDGYAFDSFDCKDEKVVYCGYLVNHWGHFLVEAVARLWYFFEDDNSVDKYVFFVEEGSSREIKGNYKEFLELLNIWNKVEIINRPTKYREVIVPELGYRWQDHYSEKYKKIFDTVAENAFTDKSWKPSKKIYFTRNSFVKAKGLEFGLDALDDFFLKNDYLILAPEKLSLSQMIFYIRNADKCAMLSGTLPHNMLFAQDGKDITIVERCVLNNENQANINRIKELNVTYVDSNTSIYTTNMSGPFIMGFNKLTEKYANDNGMALPNEKFTSKKYRESCFKGYMKAYRREYGYRWYMDDWYVSYVDYLWEAYKDGYDEFKEFLNGEKPISMLQIFDRKCIKHFIKNVLKK